MIAQEYGYENCALLIMLNDTDDTATEYITSLSELAKYNIWTTQITDRSLEILSKCNKVTDEGLGKLQRLLLLRSLRLMQCQELTEKGIGVFGEDVQVMFQPA